jgi:HAD superfamily hydrolase (TIGR01509 family)
MPVLLFLVRSLVIDNEQQRERERTVTARLMVFLDDGGVMNDNSTRALQWQRLVSEFFVPLLGGSADAWTRANRVVADRLFEPDAWRSRVQAAPDYGSFERAYQVEWLQGMCELVEVGTPPEEDCLRLARRAAAFITCRVQAAFPGVVDTIRSLHRQGYTLHTASGESSLDLAGYLQAMGVRKCFDRLYGSDLIATLKEGPEYYERMFADLGLAPADALVVDDSPRAIEWATRVGARAVLVGDSSLPQTGTTVHIESLVELPAMLQRRYRTIRAMALSPPRDETLAVFSYLWYSDNCGERRQET